MKKLSPIALALALAFPMGAQAQSPADMQKQIDMLKAQIAELKQMVAQKPAVAPADAGLKAEVAQMRVKMEAMDDAHQESGFAGIKVSGFLDPTYIFSKRSGRGDFIFLNGDDGTPNVPSDSWSYMNSSFGGVTLKVEKTFENDMQAVLKFRPYKNSSNQWVDEAYASMPVGDGMKAVVGKRISFNGYELGDAPDYKTVTHNLLFDYSDPLQMVGVGLDFSAFGMDWMTMVGNMNEVRDIPGRENHNRGFHWRGDMEMSEFWGWGASGMHGTRMGERYHYVELDTWYTYGDLSLNGQIERTTHRNSAVNGGDMKRTGVSLLGAYNLGSGWELVGRADWLKDRKNGGSAWLGAYDAIDTDDDGVGDSCPLDAGTAMPAAVCGDYLGGYGTGAVFDDTLGAWVLGDTNKGPTRTAFTLGLNYTLNEWSLLKFELRHDRSDLRNFFDWTDKSFKKSNTTFGAQAVVKF